jgi:hypothetical protein
MLAGGFQLRKDRRSGSPGVTGTLQPRIVGLHPPFDILPESVEAILWGTSPVSVHLFGCAGALLATTRRSDPLVGQLAGQAINEVSPQVIV